MAQRKKPGTEARREARRDQVAAERAARQQVYDQRAAEARLHPRKVFEFHGRAGSALRIRFDFTNTVTLPFNVDKDSVDDLGPRVREQIRLIQEAERDGPVN